jgi:hypothetical protein
VYPFTRKRYGPFRAGRVLQETEVDVERCPFRPQWQKQAHHMFSDFVAHFMLKKIGERGSSQGKIKFLAPQIYLLAGHKNCY